MGWWPRTFLSSVILALSVVLQQQVDERSPLSAVVLEVGGGMGVSGYRTFQSFTFHVFITYVFTCDMEQGGGYQESLKTPRVNGNDVMNGNQDRVTINVLSIYYVPDTLGNTVAI